MKLVLDIPEATPEEIRKVTVDHVTSHIERVNLYTVENSPLIPTTIFSEVNFPHALEYYKHTEITTSIYVVPLFDSDYQYQVVKGTEEVNVLMASQVYEADAIVLGLNEFEAVEFIFSKNIANILTANYCQKYHMIKYLRAVISEDRLANFTFKSNIWQNKVGQLIGVAQTTVKNIETIGDYDVAVLNKLDKAEIGFVEALELVKTDKRNKLEVQEKTEEPTNKQEPVLFSEVEVFEDKPLSKGKKAMYRAVMGVKPRIQFQMDGFDPMQVNLDRSNYVSEDGKVKGNVVIKKKHGSYYMNFNYTIELPIEV